MFVSFILSIPLNSYFLTVFAQIFRLIKNRKTAPAEQVFNEIEFGKSITIGFCPIFKYDAKVEVDELNIFISLIIRSFLMYNI